MSGKVTLGVDPATGDTGLVGNESVNELSKITLDAGTMRKKMDEFLQGVIRERVEMLGGDKTIQDALDRRIEVAIKTVCAGKLEAVLELEARKRMLVRLEQEIAKLKIDVLVAVK